MRVYNDNKSKPKKANNPQDKCNHQEKVFPKFYEFSTKDSKITNIWSWKYVKSNLIAGLGASGF